ncbi:glycosyltransferase family 2 protein [Staphylococcus cohnii]|uniref:Glycosyltransferase family 2 protein n=2 Tax=Staphylococcus cohnii TaxID=29382 RepID=A0ABT6IYZ7_9STAP|nr:glycosyltransferase family 2 protein [Staphylococcus cohnii]TGP63433.1 glycosyltransferase family 2 protein [bacterium M00.F.Ca.ET.229.01.1.1]TGS39515.1 glycosyltransferase family 2 protein [bacterium M00.F.Ca.ET.180.01.1.1]KKI64341.1 Teichoic acid biosynthesis protein X [Staphylococcus cohnii subsp. cohnii]MDE1709638.1 glycosyltransferase family 2 protein [Staphylococcus cohnii]MDH5139235.1 glycosyltransferase family 2 protein [Staphylococcus cohnii]
MKISIIIPVYNAANTIQRAISSVDTKQDYEIICVNDGSTDESKQVLERLQKAYKNIRIINQENQGAAMSRNNALAYVTGDAFMFLDADDVFLPNSIDAMADYFHQDEHVDIVLGQIGRLNNGTWQSFYTHQPIQKFDKVNLAQCPEMMQSIGPGGKLFSAIFKDLRFDEDVVFCEEHTFVIKAYKKARDVQLLPFIVYGYHEEKGSVTAQRADRFVNYMSDAIKVRHRVMDTLLLREERIYYSYRMDELIVSYLLQAYLTNNKKLTDSFLDVVTSYMYNMQEADYSGEAMFRIIKVIEQCGKNWNKSLYKKWQEALLNVGIGRPNYYRFQIEVLPKRVKFRGKLKLKQILKK